MHTYMEVGTYFELHTLLKTEYAEMYFYDTIVSTQTEPWKDFE
jgi:hypothetical protein